MIIETLRVTNFLSHKDTMVSFVGSALWLVLGDNGAGKSALFDAVHYALYGHHRVKQSADLLVKHGEQRATIELVFSIAGQRYRVQLSIHHERGNQGGQLERDDAGKWRMVPVDGRVGVWAWLAPHLPTEDLFLSAIFLRQGQTAHFLRGDATARRTRLRELVDLGQYDELADAAVSRGRRANGRIQTARAVLEGQGDVSDAALTAAVSAVRQAEDDVTDAERMVEAVATVRAGAERHERCAADLKRFGEQRQSAQRLLDDEPAIRADAAAVAAWDGVAAPLAELWREVDRGSKRRADEGTARDLAAAAETRRAELERSEQTQRSQLDALEAEMLPMARDARDQARERVGHLALEVDVAVAAGTARDALAEVERWRGQDEVLAACQTRQEAMPRLRRFVETASDVEARGAELGAAEAELGTGAAALETAEMQAEQLGQAAETAGAEAEKARQKLEDISTRVNHLSGRVERRAGLGADEDECPVCAQALDAGAHEHVRQVLADETAALATLTDEREVASRDALKRRRAYEATAIALEKAKRTVASTETHVGSLRKRLNEAQMRVERAAATQDAARAEVATHHPAYLGLLDRVTTAWLATEEVEVASTLRAAREGAARLASAANALVAAETTVATLRSRRAAGTEQLADKLSVDDLRALALDAEAARVEAEARIGTLQGEVASARQRLSALTGAMSEARASGAAALERANQAASDVADAKLRVREIRDGLEKSWTTVAADPTAYTRELTAIDSRRPNARRFVELGAALGARDELDRQIAATTLELESVPEAHRIAAVDARQREATARTELLQAAATLAGRKHDLAAREESRERAIALKGQIEVAAAEAKLFGDLADLLKANGPIQMHVASLEQRRIAGHINDVLERLRDPLRATIADPRRAGAGQDLVVIDTSDPVQTPRYFEFLSGGEQFRVALAVALALHRRVGREPGTIVIDEGFGALDERHRDALALQMSNVTQGILGLGLAKSVIICSHSSEVQRHFPYRWKVVKQAGTARVERAELEEALATA